MTAPTPIDLYAILRQHMVESQLRNRGLGDQRVLAAMLRVPRHEFVHEGNRAQAYEDHPLPIGEGQTISQPYIVGSMLEALELKPTDRVLEVGTGSGYVAALLAELAAEIVSMERHPTLVEEARRVLSNLGHSNVKIIIGDGAQGFPPGAPYDAITVAAATLEVPRALLAQLREGGRMIVPVGPPDAQQLQLIRMQDGRPVITLREACRFVPLVAGVNE